MPNAKTDHEANKPLTIEDLDIIFADFKSLDRLLLAVSGGSDSLALMILCHEWLSQRNYPLSLYIASVDHGLRPEAASECAHVAAFAEERDLPHVTLTWRGEKSSSNIQAKARQARYSLLSLHAQTLSCDHMAVAHHLDDQAETVMMRLMRGSGVTGLGAMRKTQLVQGITIHRPFLETPKARLTASLQERGIDWIDDPSNKNIDYLRVRVRSMLPQFANEGCDAARLAATARRLQRADEALSRLTDKYFAQMMRAEAGRSLSVSGEDLFALDEEFRLRLLRKALVHVAGGAYPPREDRILQIDQASSEACQTGHSIKRTMGGCCFEVLDTRLWIYREVGRLPQIIEMDGSEPTVWLDLYKVQVTFKPDQATPLPVLRALGEQGRICLAEAGMRFSNQLRPDDAIPSGLIEALPSVWWQNEPKFVVDWPEISKSSGFGVEFEEKNTNFVPKVPLK